MFRDDRDLNGNINANTNEIIGRAVIPLEVLSTRERIGMIMLYPVGGLDSSTFAIH